MERAVLHIYAKYSPRDSDGRWRTFLRSLFFARTHAYIEDFRASGEANMTTLAVLDLEEAAMRAQREAADARRESDGGGHGHHHHHHGAFGRRQSSGHYGPSSGHRPDGREGEGGLHEIAAESESYGFRRSHRRRSSAGGGDDDDEGHEMLTLRAVSGAGYGNFDGDDGSGGGSFDGAGSFVIGPDNLLHRRKTAEEQNSIRRKYDLADFLTTFLVILNAAFLAVWDPLAPQEGILPYLDNINNAFTFLFLLDLALHVTCLGFVIFRADKWYIFDAIVVIAGVVSTILELSMSLSSFALGTLRALRVVVLLRTARTFETVRIIIKTIVGTVVRLKHLIMLFIMFLLVFGIAAVSQYSSRLRTRCVNKAFWNETQQAEMIQKYYQNHPYAWPEAYYYPPQNGSSGSATTIPSTTAATTAFDPNASSYSTFPSTTVAPSPTTSSRGPYWPPFLPATSPKAGPREVAYTPRNIYNFVKYQEYDTFSAIVIGEEFQRRQQEYECQRQLYTVNRSLFEVSWCGRAFDNEVMGYNESLSTPDNIIYPYMALVTLSPPAGDYYVAQRVNKVDPKNLSVWETAVWEQQTCDPTDALFLFGYRCPEEYRCERLRNPQNGHVGFDNLGEAMLTLFVAVTFEGWYHTMTWTMCGVDPTAAIFFVFVVTIGALFITNLAVVELTVQYEIRIREEWRFQNEKKLRIKNEAANWLWAFYDKIISEMEESTEDYDDELEDEIEFLPFAEKLTFYTRKITKHVGFKFLVVVSIVSNVVILGMYSASSGKTYDDLATLAHYCFVAILAFELVVRLFAADRLWQFIVGGSFLNCIDVIAFIFGLVDVFVNESANCRPAMALRLGRLAWELSQFSETFRRWGSVVARTIKASLVIGLLLLVLIFLFGVVGLYLFGGTFCNMYDSDIRLVIPDNTSLACPMRPRANYDTIATAMLTTLIITSVDGWDQIMYNGIDARGPIFSVYFIAVLLICKYLVVNLLIGIFLHEATVAQRMEDERLLTENLYDDKMRGMTKTKRQKLKEFLSSFFATPEQAKVDELDPRYSKFQLQLQKFVESTAFQASMVVLTFISCVCIAVESPLRAPDTKEEALLLIFDVSSNAIFAFEAVLKIIAYGLILGRQSYIRRDEWNVFDLLIVGISFVSQGLLYAKKGDRTQPVFSALRVLRAIRPIRYATKIEGFKIIFQAIKNSLKSLFFLFFMLFSLGTLWGVMGVQWFAGAFSRCTDLEIMTETACLVAGELWVTPYNNFDNIAQAYMSLLAISTTENWADIMFNGMDAVGRGKGPIVNEGKRFAVYFGAFVTIGGLYFVALLISVLIRSYQEAKQSFPHRNYFLNPHEQAWAYSHYDLLSKVPLVDYDSTPTTLVEAVFIKIRDLCRRIERSPLFDLLVYCMIIVGFIVAAVDHYPKSTAMTDFISISSLLFAVAFCVEMAIRIVSEGLHGFFKSLWNRFDLLITFLNLLGIVMELAWSQSTFVTVFRLLRAVRMLRLVRKSRTLQSTLKRILLALYALKNTVAILFLVYFVFGVMGMRMFGRVSYSFHINQRQNFGDIVNAMLIMFRCSTGGEWLQLVEAISQPSPKCDLNMDGCITPAIAQTYFIAFEIIAQYMFINLFTSVIFDIFTETDEVALTVSSFEAGQLIKLWTCFDPEKTYRIESRFLVSFLRGIPRQCILSLGPIHEARRRQQELIFLKDLEVNELNGKVELQDLIMALLQRYYQEMMIEKRARIKQRALRLEAAKLREEGLHPDDPRNAAGGNGKKNGNTSDGNARSNSQQASSAASNNASEHSSADANAMALQDAKPTLSHDTSRALRRHADKVFRREARNLHRPPGDGQHVAKRYAINVIEQYYLQSQARRAEQLQISAEASEMKRKMDQFQRDLERKTQREIEEARRERGGGGDLGDDLDFELDELGGTMRKKKKSSSAAVAGTGKELWKRVRGKLIASAKAQQQQQQQALRQEDQHEPHPDNKATFIDDANL